MKVLSHAKVPGIRLSDRIRTSGVRQSFPAGRRPSRALSSNGKVRTASRLESIGWKRLRP